MCLINDFQVECGDGYVKHGDKYRCRDCGNTVITGFGEPWLPKHRRRESCQDS